MTFETTKENFDNKRRKLKIILRKGNGKTYFKEKEEGKKARRILPSIPIAEKIRKLH